MACERTPSSPLPHLALASEEGRNTHPLTNAVCLPTNQYQQPGSSLFGSPLLEGSRRAEANVPHLEQNTMKTKGEQFAGVTVALVTPFRNGDVDFEGLGRLVDWHVEQ